MNKGRCKIPNRMFVRWDYDNSLQTTPVSFIIEQTYFFFHSLFDPPYTLLTRFLFVLLTRLSLKDSQENVDKLIQRFYSETINYIIPRWIGFEKFQILPLLVRYIRICKRFKNQRQTFPRQMFPLAVLFDQDLVQDDVSRCGEVQVPANRSLRRSGTPKFPSSTFRRRSITGSTLLDASAQPSTRPPNSVYGCCHQHSLSLSPSPSLSSDCQMLLPLSVTGLDRTTRTIYVNNTYVTKR